MAFDLNTDDGTFQQRARKSYRYEAVASVQVSVTHDYRQTFDLHLVSGQPISFRVADPSTLRLPDEDDQAQSDATQDATGLRNTLRVLEGVAAEGKTWIAREAQAQNAWHTPAANHDPGRADTPGTQNRTADGLPDTEATDSR
jgi:hypothetical protein